MGQHAILCVFPDVAVKDRQNGTIASSGSALEEEYEGVRRRGKQLSMQVCGSIDKILWLSLGTTFAHWKCKGNYVSLSDCSAGRGRSIKADRQALRLAEREVLFRTPNSTTQPAPATQVLSRRVAQNGMSTARSIGSIIVGRSLEVGRMWRGADEYLMTEWLPGTLDRFLYGR